MDTPTYMMTPEIKKELLAVCRIAVADALEALACATVSSVPMEHLLASSRAVQRAIAACAAIDPDEAGLAIRHSR